MSESNTETNCRVVTRRKLLAAASRLAAVTSMSPLAFSRNFPDDRYSRDAAPIRYPDPDVLVLDPRFKFKISNAAIMRLHSGMLWAEGPAWNAVGRYLIWSDIPSNEQLRWIEEDGHVSRQFRFPSNNSNGNVFDRDGRQISFEHATRRVVRFEWDGTVTVLADSHAGKGLNAPNDGAVHPDGWLLFTDPGYGGLSDYEGIRVNTGSPQPIQKEAVYRIDAPGKVEKVADEPFKPNGLCFSPDYRRVYVSDTGKSHYEKAKSIVWVYDVQDRSLRNPRQFCSMEYEGKTGLADGIRCDEEGNLWTAAGWVGDGYDGVHVFSPDGARIGLIRMPEIVSNVCFGGSKRNRLFMTASQSLYALNVGTRGA
jgi:gluconolactonase